MISTLILTRNEEADLPGCLDSVAWCDDVHVFDSCSTDRTAEIARSHGANFTQREFDGYASQRNAALDTLPFQHEWIFILDADERCTPELAREMLAGRVPAAPTDVNGFRLRRRDFLNGTWLKHAQISPYYIRLVRRGHARYTREVNEVLEVEGRVAELRSPLDHFPFSKGMAHWMRKHDVYSTMEARVIAEGASRGHALVEDALSQQRISTLAASRKRPSFTGCRRAPQSNGST